ncbi:hypothetical protein ACSS6W_004965 [Trichoderma asperelloides]
MAGFCGLPFASLILNLPSRRCMRRQNAMQGIPKRISHGQRRHINNKGLDSPQRASSSSYYIQSSTLFMERPASYPPSETYLLAYAYGNQLSSRSKLAQSPTSTGSMITKSQRRQSAECRAQMRAEQSNATQRNAQRSGTHGGWTTSQQEAPYLYEGLALLAPSPHGDLTARKRSLGEKTPPRPHSIDGSRARWATARRLRVASWADAEGEKKAPISSLQKSQSQKSQLTGAKGGLTPASSEPPVAKQRAHATTGVCIMASLNARRPHTK